MNTKDFFNQHLVFRFDEFLSAAEKETGLTVATSNNARTLLHRYCKQGKLLNIRKGLYAVSNEKAYLSNFINPALIAGKATDDAVIAYHSALESHDIAYTTFNEHTYITKRRTNDFNFQDQHYRAIYAKTLDLTDVKKEFEILNIMGIQLRRTSLARTIVDVLDRPHLSGGWEKVMRSLERVTHFNVSSAIDYALSLKQSSIAAKLGYFLDQRPEYFKTDPNLVNQLLLHAPKQPYYIERSTKGKGIFIKKWQIIVPKYLHEQQWKEPNELDY